MKQEQQRIAIAEACGWKRSDLRPSWCHPDNWSMAKNGSYEVWGSQDKLPNYLNDLNAMHDAEEVLTNEQLEVYCNILHKPNHGVYWAIHAIASQRAEAFLRTIGKWEESK
jgi:hypothetical protein